MTPLPLDRALPGVSTLVQGCMGLGGGWNTNPVGAADVRRAHEVVDAALDAGIDLFDHADIYTFGKAEAVFGTVLRERPGLREQIRIQSKCGIRFADAAGPKRYDLSAAWITRSVEGSLARLRIERLDALLLHRPDPLMEPDEIAGAFDALRTSGKVAHFGVSNMHAHQLRALQAALPEPLVANQIELSLGALAWLEEGVLAGQPGGAQVGFTAGTIEYCRETGIQLQAWGALCQGLFTGRNVDGEPAHVRATAALVAELAASHDTSREAIVLGFLLRHPARIQPVIGTTDPQRIAACARAMELALPREDFYRLYETARGTELP
jgi:predicted oxidoreductase